MNILIRADSSSKIGTGHIIRDLVLAKNLENEYKNTQIIFASLNLDGNINQKIIENGYTVKILKSNNKDELLKLIKKLNIDMLVFDNYDIDYKFEKFIKERTNAIVMSLDDTYEKHCCNILLNHNIYANKKGYKNLVPKDCELRCGAKYTLLRNEFYKEKKKKYKKDKKTTILITMGGADSSNLNIKILKVLKKFKNIYVHLVTTNANKNLKKLKHYTKNKKWIKLHINSNKIAKLMRKSDFGIITPSVTANEAQFMNLPFITIKTASNQNKMFNYLKKKRHHTLNKFNSNKLKKILIKAI